MSRITNARINPGDTLNAASLNDKFSAIQASTAAGTINADNVRNEGIDLGNFTGGGATELFVKEVQNDTYSAPTVHTIATESTVGAEMTLAGGTQTFESTDVLRVYWQVEVTNRNLVLHNSGTAATARDILGGLFWCVWLQWYNTGTSAWETVPGQDAYGTYSGFNGFRANNCPALMPIPACVRSSQNSTVTAPVIGDSMYIPTPDDGIQYMSFMGSYASVAGANQTYSKIRLRINGLFRGEHDGSASYISRTTDYAAPYSITTRNINLGHILMKKI